jgi:hypothetical protein
MISSCLWVLFLLLGIMGIYMKQVAKITTTTFMTKMSFGSMIIASLILLVQFPVLIAYFSGLRWCQTVKGATDCKISHNSEHNFSDALGAFIGIQCVFTLCQLAMFVALWMGMKKTL